jgi:hypothetical protein
MLALDSIANRVKRRLRNKILRNERRDLVAMTPPHRTGSFGTARDRGDSV